MSDMKRRYKILVALLLSLILTGFVALSILNHQTRQKSANIFNEMYQKRGYWEDFSKVTVKTFRAMDKDMNDTNDWNTRVTYNPEVLPEGYSDVSLMFFGHDAILSVSFNCSLDANVRINAGGTYDVKKKVLKKRVYIITGSGENEHLIDKVSQVESYLEKYNITTKDLDTYYNAIVNNLVLKDWTSIYNSQYAPDDYGNVKVKTQWENW